MCNNLKAKKSAELIWIGWQNRQTYETLLDPASDGRYLVISERPIGTKGWSKEKLIDLVTRNSMTGVELAKEPTL